MSESNKFTPGPWFNGQDGFNLGCGVVYARHANGNPKDVATIRGWGGEQQQNSRLIASAPDLLEALENLLWHAEVLEEFIESERGRGRNADQLYADGEMHNYMVEAKASILKARGQK